MTQSFWHDDARYLETYWQAIPGIWVHGDLALRTPKAISLHDGALGRPLKVAGKRLGPAEGRRSSWNCMTWPRRPPSGIADAAKGQKLVVFVVPRPGVSVPDDALRRPP